jgi:hypothetical protein
VNVVWRATRAVAHEARLLAIAALDAIPYEDLEPILNAATLDGARDSRAFPVQPTTSTYNTAAAHCRSTITG